MSLLYEFIVCKLSVLYEWLSELIVCKLSRL
jgi:hypothetical protein